MSPTAVEPLRRSEGRRNLKDLTPEELRLDFAAQGLPRYRADQIAAWLYQRGVEDPMEMTDLDVGLRRRIEEQWETRALDCASVYVSKDGTRKLALRARDGALIEAVLIPEERRNTLCVSTQVGCPLACSFCATGALGFTRNLTTAEIVDQLCRALDVLGDDGGITNIVFMGMGEPLANYRSVVPVLELLVSDWSYGMSRRRVTVSTSGIVPHIEKLADDCNVALAVSLHAPTDELRDQIVPINKLHPINTLLDACWQYAAKRSNRFITFEYVMLRDVNDSLAHANQLAALLKNKPAKINLIPFNPFPGTAFKRSSVDTIRHFQERLRQRGLVATTRKTRGDDINAACGQLAGKVSDRIKVRLGDKKRRVATS